MKAKEIDLGTLRIRLRESDDMVKSLEDKLLTITILEHKIKALNDNHKKEKQDMKNYYDNETNNLNKEIQHIHNILSVNLANDEKINFLHKELNAYKLYNIKKIQTLASRLQKYEAMTQVDGSNDDISLKHVIKSEETKENTSPVRRPITAKIESNYNSAKTSVKTFISNLRSPKKPLEPQKIKKKEQKLEDHLHYFEDKKKQVVDEVVTIYLKLIKSLILD